MDRRLTRRAFARTGATAAMTTGLVVRGSSAGANERIRLGFIGVGNRGGQLLDAFKPHADAQFVAFCDVYQPYLERARKQWGAQVDSVEDYRRLLERKDIDAVVIATPDHWHALQTVHACQAEKDVYVEKPLSITIREGRAMVAAARKTKRVVQVGLHRRSMPLYQDLVKSLAGNKLGKITVARAYRLSNMFPRGIGKPADGPPPAGLNWDLWLGPRPQRPFNAAIAPYKFRWRRLYSSQLANWGVHYFDTLRWLMGVTAPTSLCAVGGQYAVPDARDIPDTCEAIFELETGGLLVFGQYEATGRPIFAVPNAELELRGTQGVLYSGDHGWEIQPERGGQFQEPKPRMKGEKVPAPEPGGKATTRHARNFLDCIKSRQRPACDVEDGHRSTTFALLANISLAVRARLDWDPKAERITNHPAANDLLHYEYRSPYALPD